MIRSGEIGDLAENRPSERPAQLILLLLLATVPLMQPPIPLLGFTAIPFDFLFAGLALLWVALLMTGRASFVFDRSYLFVVAYLLAMVASAVAAGLPASSGPKLLTQIYLISLPVVVCSLIRDESILRMAILSWLTGTAIVVTVALISLALFAIDPENSAFRFAHFHFGTLPPGDYPRLRMTFLNANMACNYLSVSLMLLLAAWRLGWVGKVAFLLLLSGIVIAAVATISPGLGGIAGGLGVWIWLVLRLKRAALARLALALGAIIALLFVAAMIVTPILHSTAPFLIHIPFVETSLAPSGRLMVWLDAARNFLADPLFGRGIGSDAARVVYQSPSGWQRLSDAHNTFLNIAVQCGVLGLAALLAFVAHAYARTAPFRLPSEGLTVVRVAAGLALLNGLVYQGLGGSFEDARHLWLIFGLLIASDRIERASRKGARAGTAADAV